MESPILVMAFALFALGTLVSCLNFYLSFIRYPLHIRRGGTWEDFRWMSGIPLIGSLALWASAFLLDKSPVAGWAWVPLAISVIDTGGLHWVPVALVWHYLFDQPGDGTKQ